MVWKRPCVPDHTVAQAIHVTTGAGSVGANGFARHGENLLTKDNIIFSCVRAAGSDSCDIAAANTVQCVGHRAMNDSQSIIANQWNVAVQLWCNELFLLSRRVQNDGYIT